MLLIIVDGIDGAGKTSYTKLLTETLKEEKDTLRLKFPTRTPIPSEVDTPDKEMGFYLRDFEREMKKVGDPEIIIMDRSCVSTLTYQGFNKDLEKNENFDHILKEGMKALLPDDTKKVILIDMDCELEESLRRISMRRKAGEDTGDKVDQMPYEERKKELSKLRTKMNEVYPALVKDGQAKFPDVIFSYYHIDTTNRTPEESVRYTLRLI